MAHIPEATLSPAPDGHDQDDPVSGWSRETTIVTYCVCPHTLAGRRGASLLDDGFTEVYGLDGGLFEWIEEGYPIESNDTDSSLPSYEIVGETDPAFAGEYVWAIEPTTDQRESAVVHEDGTYELLIQFDDVDESTIFEIETPTGTHEKPLEELTDEQLTDKPRTDE